MLKLVNIKKDYKIVAGTVHALKGVSLNFRRNEFVCILGQSGCGKTTLLNIVGGLDQYTSGDLVIQGTSTKNFRDKDWDVYRNHRIGFIFQSYNLIPHQTVLGNVELALTIAGLGKEERKERAKQALERVGLGNELEKRPNQLSGGQMQRVAIARALVNNPDILLADEPTGALDSATSVQIMELIKEIAGERLVIMVTHNPELAVRYASRIVRLKDGLVEEDSDPYSDEDESKECGAEEDEAKQEKQRARMSFLTSLSLSARNLFTKKGRTILTSVAGSIGIISVCLVLALSSGFNAYITRTEEDMLSYYPVTVSENSFDMTAIMARMQEVGDAPDMSELDNKVYVNSLLTNMAQGMTVQNNISENYLNYIGEMNEEWYYAIQYGYGVSLSDNLFTATVTGTTDEEERERFMSLSELKTFYTQELTMQETEYARLAYLIDYLGDVVGKMPGTSDFTDESFGDYILSQYDVVAGSFPKNENETVLVIGENNDMTDLTLVQLGFLDEQTFLSLFGLGENENTKDEYLTVSFDDILKKEFVLYGNDSIYERNADASPLSYPFTYRGERSSLEVGNGGGIPLKVSGVLRLKEGMTYGCLSNGLYLTEATVASYLANNEKSELVQWMTDKNNTFQFESGGEKYELYRSPAEYLNHYFTLYTTTVFGQEISMYINVDNEQVLRRVGGDATPNHVSFYLRDFEAKENVLAYLDDWNERCASGGSYGGIILAEEDRVTYTDTVGMLMTMMQTMLDVITYVLVAFTAISLVVSSVMIGIITYVSVVERVKEIGVLRSLGARKRDIKNLFNAETFIIGLSAGVIGIAVTYLLEIPINAIIFSLTQISGIAALSPVSAVVMVLISIVLTLISGLIPASAAAKKDPVIALRTE